MASAPMTTPDLLSSEKGYAAVDNEKSEDVPYYNAEERIWRPVFSKEESNTAGPFRSELFRSVQGAFSPSDIVLLRDNFHLTTWILLGAALQSALVYLCPSPYSLLPAAAILGIRILDVLLQVVGLRANPYMKDVILGKFAFHQPDEQGRLVGEPSQKGMTVLLLAARSNHPLGMFAPGYKDLADYFVSMTKTLEEDAAKYGYRGGSPYIGRGGDRTTSQEVMSVFYFDSIDGIHKFAHSPSHRKGWDWWNANVHSLDHIAINHEIFEAAPESIETIYENFHRAGLTGHNVKTADGKWIPPLVNANEGQYRTSHGRLNRHDHGRGNDKYGGPEYKPTRLFCPALARRS